MRTKELKRTALMLSATLALAAAGQRASAVDGPAGDIEEIVVYGVAGAPTPADNGIRARMSREAQRLNLAQRAELERAFARMRARRIQLAAAEIPTRG